MLWAISPEWGQGWWWTLGVSTIWCFWRVSTPAVSCSPLQLPRGAGSFWERTFPLPSWVKGQNVAILGKDHTKSRSKYFPWTQGTRLLLDCRQFLDGCFFFMVKISFKHFLISCYILFLWLSQNAYKEKCFYGSTHFHFTLHWNQIVWTHQWGEFCGQCHFGIFHFREGLHILDASVIAGFVHFLYRFCNPKNILLDLHSSPVEFEMKK